MRTAVTTVFSRLSPDSVEVRPNCCGLIKELKDEQSSLGRNEGRERKEDLHQIGGFKVADDGRDDSEITAPN